MEAGFPEIFSTVSILDQSERHADSGQSESPVPVDRLAHIPAGQRGQESADVDAHVKNREPGVAAMIVRTVKLAYHGADVRLQQSRADPDEPKPGIKRADLRKRHAEVAECDNNSAVENSAALAQDAVGDPATGQVGQVDQGRVQSVNSAGFADVES